MKFKEKDFGRFMAASLVSVAASALVLHLGLRLLADITAFQWIWIAFLGVPILLSAPIAWRFAKENRWLDLALRQLIGVILILWGLTKILTFGMDEQAVAYTEAFLLFCLGSVLPGVLFGAWCYGRLTRSSGDR